MVIHMLTINITIRCSHIVKLKIVGANVFSIFLISILNVFVNIHLKIIIDKQKNANFAQVVHHFCQVGPANVVLNFISIKHRFKKNGINNLRHFHSYRKNILLLIMHPR